MHRYLLPPKRLASMLPLLVVKKLYKMSNYSKLYWLTRLDGFQGFICFILGASLMVLIFYWVSYIAEGDFGDQDKFIKKYGKYKKNAFWFGIISAIMLVFLPSKSEVVFIVAGGKTMDFVEKDTSINKLPAQTTKIITDFLQKQIEEVKK